MKPFEQVEMHLEPPTLLHSDMVRIGRQRSEVWAAMYGGEWLTLAELEERTGFPQASISARIRDFRKPKFGGHIVERRRRFGADRGTHEYRLWPQVG